MEIYRSKISRQYQINTVSLYWADQSVRFTWKYRKFKWSQLQTVYTICCKCCGQLQYLHFSVNWTYHAVELTSQCASQILVSVCNTKMSVHTFLDTQSCRNLQKIKSISWVKLEYWCVNGNNAEIYAVKRLRIG